jgi:quinol monooxygenase YgiN
MPIYLTAVIKSKPENVDQVRSRLLDLAVHSKQEKACIQYDLHQDSNVFIFHEIWESQEGLDLHNQQPYLKQFVLDIPALIEEPVALYQTDFLNT